jgi:hypothetical protein
LPSSKSETGFKNVHKEGGRYVTKIRENGRNRMFASSVASSTPEEAAFCYAKHIGAERAAEETAEAAFTTGAGHRVKPCGKPHEITNNERQIETKKGRRVIKPRAWEG